MARAGPLTFNPHERRPPRYSPERQQQQQQQWSKRLFRIKFARRHKALCWFTLSPPLSLSYKLAVPRVLIARHNGTLREGGKGEKVDGSFGRSRKQSRTRNIPLRALHSWPPLLFWLCLSRSLSLLRYMRKSWEQLTCALSILLVGDTRHLRRAWSSSLVLKLHSIRETGFLKKRNNLIENGWLCAVFSTERSLAFYVCDEIMLNYVSAVC